jgi:hypothetical protein
MPVDQRASLLGFFITAAVGISVKSGGVVTVGLTVNV